MRNVVSNKNALLQTNLIYAKKMHPMKPKGVYELVVADLGEGTEDIGSFHPTPPDY